MKSDTLPPARGVLMYHKVGLPSECSCSVVCLGGPKLQHWTLMDEVCEVFPLSDALGFRRFWEILCTL